MVEKYKIIYRVFIITFWALVCRGFVMHDMFRPLLALYSPFLLVTDMIIVILGLLTMRRRTDWAIFLSFVVICIVSKTLNGMSWVVTINGMRYYIGLTLVVPILRYLFTNPNHPELQTKLVRQLRIFLILQAPCLTIQWLRYGANDAGGGTFGYGGSGMVSMLIYLISFFLVTQNWDFNDIWGSIKRNKWNFILLYPTLLNETKISFILLLVYLFLLVNYNRKLMLRIFYAAPVGVFAVIVLFNLYCSITHQDPSRVFSADYMDEYLLGNERYDEIIEMAQRIHGGDFEDEMTKMTVWGEDLPRFMKFPLVYSTLPKYGGGRTWGLGTGQFRGSTIGETAFIKQYGWMVSGTRGWILFVFVELGFMGVLWYLISSAAVIFGKPRATKHRHGRRMLLYWLVAFCIVLVYNDAPRNLEFEIPYLMLLMMVKYYRTPQQIKAQEEILAQERKTSRYRRLWK